jgi:dTDP-4-dehydrorhamnose reductase
MKKLLITGASGFLGWNLCRTASLKYQVIGVCNNHKVEVPGVTFIKCDLLQYSSLKELFQRVKLDAVIHCAAVSSPNYCQQHVSEAYKMNVTLSSSIAGLCNEREIPCVFTSTDQVFDGESAPYDEGSIVCPVNVYGQQKVTAELEMQVRHDQLVICRMPLMYGDAPECATSFIQPWIKSLKSGEKLSLFTDEVRTVVSASDAAKGLLLALERARGIIHLGGKERLSRYQFGLKLAGSLGISSELITACTRKGFPMPAPRPADVSLNSEKAFSIGYAPGLVEEELQKLECLKG